MLRAYRYRLYPTEQQREMLWKTVGACRFVFNKSLERKIKAYDRETKTVLEKLGEYDLNNYLVQLKAAYPFLNDVYSQSLQQQNKNLMKAYKNFFEGRADYPNFKSKKNPVQSFQIPQHYKVDIERERIFLPKIGWVRTVFHRPIGDGSMQTATVSLTNTGTVYISILVKDATPAPEKAPYSFNTTVGMDVGLTTFTTLSTGEKVENPKYLKNSLQRLKVLQRRLSRKVKGSQNRNKARKKVARLHETIANQRKDFQHKLSFRVLRDNQAVVVEDLNVKGMMQNHCLAQAIGDAGWSEFFRMLEYKALWMGRTIISVERFFPSTKSCHACGYYNATLTLKDREWTCPSCGTHHDRDFNASMTLKLHGLGLFKPYSGMERTVVPADLCSMEQGMTQDACRFSGA